MNGEPQGGPIAARPSRQPGPRLATALLASLLLHGAAFAYVQWVATMPDVGIQFQLPVNVELGMTDAVEPAAAPPPSAASPPAKAASAHAGASTVDAGVPAPPHAKASKKRRPEREHAKPKLASTGRTRGATGATPEGFGTQALPPGAQIALRMDMGVIRRSPLAPDVRKLLGSIPDWQAILGDAGIAPLDDLDRVLIASPDLSRERVVIAGRYTGDPSLPRDIVAHMAAAHDEPVSWSTKDGVPVAPWPDRDATRRMIALIGQHQFTISRPEDLKRVLAVAQARQKSRHRPSHDDAPNPEKWGEALLSMGDGEALSLEVEGARHFVRGPMATRFPTRLRIAVVQLSDGRVQLNGQGTYDSPEEARAALDFAERVRQAYAHQMLLRLMGMASPLEDAQLKVDGSTLDFQTDLTLAQIRLVLGYVQGVISQQQRAPGPNAPSGAPAGGGEPAAGALGQRPPPNPYRTPPEP